MVSKASNFSQHALGPQWNGHWEASPAAATRPGGPVWAHGLIVSDQSGIPEERGGWHA